VERGTGGEAHLLDGYVEDATDAIDWSAPETEVHAFVNDLEWRVGTYLYGRRMYEAMVVWETLPTERASAPDFAAFWRAADEVVYSSKRREVASARTRLERTFDVDAVRRMQDSAACPLTVGGPALAARRSAPGSSTSTRSS